jgi:hypothetical protein
VLSAPDSKAAALPTTTMATTATAATTVETPTRLCTLAMSADFYLRRLR